MCCKASWCPRLSHTRKSGCAGTTTADLCHSWSPVLFNLICSFPRTERISCFDQHVIQLLQRDYCPLVSSDLEMLDIMSEYLFNISLLAVGIIILGSTIYYFTQGGSQPLPDLPWLNTKEGELFTVLRSRYRSLFNFKQTIDGAYEQVCTLGRRCSRKPILILSSIPSKSYHVSYQVSLMRPSCCPPHMSPGLPANPKPS